MKKTASPPPFTPEEITVTPYATADYLKTNEDMAGYLEACLEEGGPELFLRGLQDALKAKGIKNIAEETGLSRESLYKTCAPGRKPQFDTIWKITKALGIPIGFPLASRSNGKATQERGRAPKRKRKHETTTT